jgi:hypothetical protein
MQGTTMTGRQARLEDPSVERLLVWIEERLVEVQRGDIGQARRAFRTTDWDRVTELAGVAGGAGGRVLTYLDLAGDALRETVILEEAAAAALISATRVLRSL